MNTRRDKKRGVAALLAMLYLVLFSVMAVGFYAAVTSAMQVSHNDAGSLRSRLAAESGMELIRYQLAKLEIPYGTPSYDVFDIVYDDLASQMKDTGNLGPYSVGLEDGQINIPANADEWIEIDDNGLKFRATIEQDGTNLRVKTRGKYGDSQLNRNIKLDYSSSEKKSSIFDYGVASRSVIEMDSNARVRGATDPTRGKVLSTNMTNATPVTLKGNSLISGDVSLVNEDGKVSTTSNASIAGSTNPAVYASHVHKGIEEPEFPTIDTSAFAPYATNILSVPNKKYDTGILKNIRIKANTNPEFTSNMTVEGVIYIETPNKVRFDSNVIVRGIIVVQNDPTGDTSTNSIEFNSNVKLYSVDTLPATPDYPASLRAMTGSMILAPKFSLLVNSNFGAIGGSIVAGKMTFDSNAEGTIKGSLINLEDTLVHMNSNVDIAIQDPDGTGNPAGMFFSRAYYPVPTTYEEIVE